MYLNMMMFFCLVSMFIVALIPSVSSYYMNVTGLLLSLILLVYNSMFIIMYNKAVNFQIFDCYSWLMLSNVMNWGDIIVTVDGVSMFFMTLSVLLMPMCIMMSWNAIDNLKKEFIVSLFVMLLLLVMVFTVMDMMVFYMLFEALLMPMFMIMGVWGSSEEKVSAAFYFFFYTLMGSLLMLLCMFKLYSLTGTTNYLNLVNMELPSSMQFWLFLGFFASFSVKMPMMPVHMWLPQAHVEAPVAGSILLAGMLLKLGGYGFISFGFPLFPIASEYLSPIIMVLSLVAMTYASFTTCSQTDMKSLMAYSSVSHMGLVTLAMFCHSKEGVVASIVMMMAHGLVSSGLFMASAVLYVSHHSSAMSYFKGVVITMPMFSIITLMLVLANMGFPLTLNFMAEFLSMLTAFNYSKVAGLLSCLGALMSTVYALYFYNSVYFGSMSSHLINSSDVLQFEFQAFLPLLLLTMMLGLFPNALMDFLIPSSLMNISL